MFELGVLDRFKNCLISSANQFRFKKNLSRDHATYSLRKVVDSVTSNGSTVNISSLDLSKAFDKTNHNALLIKLMHRNIPVNCLSIIENWLNKSLTCIKRGSTFSNFFLLFTGVRQGGVLSPTLFALYIIDLIVNVTSRDACGKLSNICVNIFLYADVTILLSSSVGNLQLLVAYCKHELDYLDMSINTKKSCCIRIGHRFNKPYCCITTSTGNAIAWSNSCKYLGVYLLAGRKFKCNFDEAKAKYYRAFNGRPICL